jgi:ABC-type dipeptide/oligopeptide/nickel transport system ATPase component
MFIRFSKPRHPYTRGLIDSVPKLGKGSEGLHDRRPAPNLLELPKGAISHHAAHAEKTCFREGRQNGSIGATSDASVERHLDGSFHPRH